MIIVQICVGSSCHLKGSEEVVEIFQKYVADNKLDEEIILTGTFCAGKCNRSGVTVIVNDEPYTGITVYNFNDFWVNTVLPAVEKNRLG